jgi:hypothetical protein
LVVTAGFVPGYADVAAGLTRRERIAGHEPTSGLLAAARGECRNPNDNVAKGLSTAVTAARNCMAVLWGVCSPQHRLLLPRCLHRRRKRTTGFLSDFFIPAPILRARAMDGKGTPPKKKA